MKKIIALVLSLVMLLACAAAMAEAETRSMGILKVNKAFNITYSPLPNEYELHINVQNDMAIFADIFSPQTNLPKMALSIVFNDEWGEVERMNDISDEDLQLIKDDFSVEYADLAFDIRETAYGTKLLTVRAPSGMDAYVYTIYKGHEIEIHLYPGADQEAITDADIDRVVAFLSDIQFVPVE